MKQKKFSIAIVLSFLTTMSLLSFQNCSKVEFAEQKLSSLGCPPDSTDPACQSSYIRISIDDQTSITLAPLSDHIVLLEKSSDVLIDSSYLEILSGNCAAKTTWQFPLSSWKLNGQDLQLGLNNWKYTAADHQAMGGCQWLGVVKGHIEATGQAVESEVVINTSNFTPNSCSTTKPCTTTQCAFTTGTPTSVGQAWVKGAANCGFACINGYTGNTCQTPPPANSCSATKPCTTTQCAFTTGTPTSVSQSWVKGAANCGFACINGYTGATCQTPPSVNSCSTTKPCTTTQCAFTTGTPTSVGQAWVKGAANCGFACINGYSGATCQTPPPTCSATANIPLWGSVPVKSVNGQCLCDLSSSSLSSTALNAKGLFNPNYSPTQNDATSVNVVDDIGRTNASDVTRHKLTFRTTPTTQPSPTCSLSCDDPNMVPSLVNGKIVCSACKTPAAITYSYGGGATVTQQFIGTNLNSPSFIKSDSNRVCYYSASGFNASATSLVGAAPAYSTTASISSVISAVNCDTSNNQYSETTCRDVYDDHQSEIRACIRTTYDSVSCHAQYPPTLLGQQCTSGASGNRLKMYSTYLGQPIVSGYITDPVTQQRIPASSPDAYYFACEHFNESYCSGVGCGYSSPGTGGGSGGGY